MEHLSSAMERHQNEEHYIQWGRDKIQEFPASSRNNNPNFRKNLQANATVAYCQNHLIDDGTIL